MKVEAPARKAKKTVPRAGSPKKLQQAVEGDQKPAGPNVITGSHVVTEGSGSYLAESSTVGGKLAFSLKETPRSVSVLTRKRLDDENITTITQAAERAPGVYVRNEGDMSDGPFFYARGFLMSVSENGVPFDSTYYGPGLDTAIYDRIEVLRGPDGLMQGQGQLGGTINLVRKAPVAKPQVKTELSAGQWDNYRTPVGSAGKVRARVVGVAETKASYLDFVGQERFLGYGTIEVDLTKDTLLTLSALSQKQEVNPYFGALHYRGTNSWTPRDLYAGAKWSVFDFERTEASVRLDHRLSSNWMLSATAMRREYNDTKRFAFHNPSAALPETGTAPININRAIWFEGEQWTGDAHVKGTVVAFGRTHEIVFGGNFEVFEHERWIRNAPGVGLWPVGNPDIPYVELSKAASTLSKISQEGIYAHGRFELLTGLKAHAGARISNYMAERRASTALQSTRDYDESGVFTPYGGLVLDLSRKWTAYASYSDIFRPQSVTTLNTSEEGLPPVVGEQYEVGIKGSLLGGRLRPSLAVFQARDTNRAVPDLVNPGYYVAAGEVLSRGFEVEVAANPKPGWEITSAYTFTDTEFVAGQPAEVGKQFNSFFPRHNIKFWMNYAFAEGTVLDGFSVGMGLRAFSEGIASFTSPYPATVTQPAYAVVDARLGYKLNDRAEIALNVSNLFDEVYLPHPGPRAYYGEPRRAMVKLLTTW